MKNLISKKLALLAMAFLASMGSAFGQSITFDFNGINDNDYNADALIVNSGSWVSSNETINFSEGEDVTIKVFAYNIYELDKVYVDGEYGTIVGSICMDQLMVLCEHEHSPGSKVELFGPHVSLTERAARLQTIVYELLTSLSDRLTRRYVKDGKVIEEINTRF